MMSKLPVSYILFGVAMLLSQLAGYNVITLALLVVSVVALLSPDEMVRRLADMPVFIVFLILSIGLGLYHALISGLQMWTVQYWGQFYFFAFAILAVSDKNKALLALKLCTYVILAADIFSNVLLLLGFDVPWSELPPVREGEVMSRFTGVKGNTLYSGSISFIGLCLLLGENTKRVWIKYIVIVLATINLALAGSFRYFIIYAIALALYFVRIYRSRILLLSAYFMSIVVVYFATQITMFINKSNFFRVMIWNHFINETAKEPLLGHGYHCMKLPDGMEFSINNLISAGVTESCILLLAYNFGIIILLLFMFSIVSTIYKISCYQRYEAELALFMGLTLDLFWGGSLDNALSLCFLLLCWYIINVKYNGQVTAQRKHMSV